MQLEIQNHIKNSILSTDCCIPKDVKYLLIYFWCLHLFLILTRNGILSLQNEIEVDKHQVQYKCIYKNKAIQKPYEASSISKFQCIINEKKTIRYTSMKRKSMLNLTKLISNSLFFGVTRTLRNAEKARTTSISKVHLHLNQVIARYSQFGIWGLTALFRSVYTGLILICSLSLKYANNLP